ncbi:class II aldolase/adducin family protein [Pseudorhodoferax sp.]|uniref:class II aldolase/adducin family protein n=1 Tax=Pseudorhodoferax sp. TaxID=1993553 RepID=UPI0039E4AF2D
MKAFESGEWATRCDLAALYRVVAHFRMTDLIDTHITARVPGPEAHFLINRYGLLFGEMRASDLVKIDLDGQVVDDRVGSEAPLGFNQAGFTIHSAVHGARPDLHWVIHTHTAAGAAVSAQEAGLLPISQHALKFHGRLAYHDYEGIALDLSERKRLVKDLGRRNAMILRNHGVLVGGATVADAFHELWFLERACQIQVQALAGGTAIRTPPLAVQERTAEQFETDDSADIVQLTWQAARRLIEAQRAEYEA